MRTNVIGAAVVAGLAMSASAQLAGTADLRGIFGGFGNWPGSATFPAGFWGFDQYQDPATGDSPFLTVGSPASFPSTWFIDVDGDGVQDAGEESNTANFSVTGTAIGPGPANGDGGRESTLYRVDVVMSVDAASGQGTDYVFTPDGATFSFGETPTDGGADELGIGAHFVGFSWPIFGTDTDTGALFFEDYGGPTAAGYEIRAYDEALVERLAGPADAAAIEGWTLGSGAFPSATNASGYRDLRLGPVSDPDGNGVISATAFPGGATPGNWATRWFVDLYDASATLGAGATVFGIGTTFNLAGTPRGTFDSATNQWEGDEWTISILIEVLGFPTVGGCNAADLAEPFNTLNIFDIFAFFNLFGAQDPVADIDGNGALNIFDIFGFFNAFGAGCP